MTTAKSTKADERLREIDIVEVSQGEARYCILGTTPLIQEAMSEKARRELLLPRGRLNAAERQTTQKHNPREEFLASAYLTKGDDAPTYLGMPVEAFKDAMRTAALDLSGASKTEVGRLTYVVGTMAPIWGIPELLISTVRSADMKRTPDQRTRPIIARWATTFTIRFVEPKMTPQAISRLLVAAGMTAGVGGWRPEKGSGNYGMFRIVPEDDAEYLDIIRHGGRDAQIEAMRNPGYYDVETERLMDWFDDEVARRRTKGSATVPPLHAVAD